MRNIFFICLFFSWGFLHSQELNCTVKVNSAKVGGSNAQVFKTLERSLNDFVNKTSWTNNALKLKNNERITCSMFITIDEVNGSIYKGSIQVQSSRPIYNSAYSSPIFNYNDKDFSFDYTEFQILNYNPNAFESNLVSVVSFYCLMIIGFDADTFSQDGGTAYYEIAQDIATTAQSSGYPGWNMGDTNQNRYFLINNVLSNLYVQFRDALYQYHFEGLDQMHKDQKTTKERIISAITQLSYMELNKPNSFLTRVFFDAKADEIVSIFTGGPVVDNATLVDKLFTISPLNSAKWSEIKI
ncbi:DUF4835 family protein [Flavobacterium sp. CYK-55]|uniref:type IX secretion system protein PorD n=1 Tax=Flavobacterium sp. CYK-55 TaxID=2835529 RepID=UPI001BCBED26|nr:DUF4835 family protein [Flavobacterium sp. CYK-55]MBS7786729.1 DUF4835 family protein [Flavobacterium sp. CYK-55]